MRSSAMNEFLEQFLIESRELIAQASDDLLVLEHNPEDTNRFDSAFRALPHAEGGGRHCRFRRDGARHSCRRGYF